MKNDKFRGNDEERSEEILVRRCSFVFVIGLGMVGNREMQAKD